MDFIVETEFLTIKHKGHKLLDAEEEVGIGLHKVSKQPPFINEKRYQAAVDLCGEEHLLSREIRICGTFPDQAYCAIDYVESTDGILKEPFGSAVFKYDDLREELSRLM